MLNFGIALQKNVGKKLVFQSSIFKGQAVPMFVSGRDGQTFAGVLPWPKKDFF